MLDSKYLPTTWVCKANGRTYPELTQQFVIDQFTFSNVRNGVFVAEASSLRLKPGYFPQYVHLTNPKTNCTCVFISKGTKVINDELVAVLYQAISPSLPVFELHIIND